MRRRDFLVGSTAALAAGGLVRPRVAGATTWGTGPAEAAAHLLPAGVRAEKVLEIFSYGGIAPFESFYVVPDYGRPSDPEYRNQQWYLFANDHQDIYGRNCGLDPSAWLQPWKTDALGKTVNLGPVAWPIRQRPDVLARMRVVVMRHDLEPHEAAIPYMLSGMRLGNVRMAGMGTHVQRYFQEQGSTAGRLAPHSYVLTPENIFATDNLRASTSVGVHPGAARPLALTINEANNLGSLLERSHLTTATRPKVDALLAHYRDSFSAHHVDVEGTALRSNALADHGYSLSSVLTAPELADVLGSDLLAPEGHSSCGNSDSLDYNRVGIRAAASLLNNPTDPARYVNVIDTGLDLADGGGGYDTHFEHPYTQAENGMSMLQNLVDHINEPGENDPSKIDLDDTTVIITTEFGRSPVKQFGGNGTNHHPYGYVVVMIGGAIGPDQAGVVGAIGPDAVATDYVTPAEFRAACLSAMGMYPFAQESFAVGDVRNIANELDGLVWLNEYVLGRTT